MKKVFGVLAAGLILMMVSCSTSQKGCPSNGRNIGAERLLSGDKKTMKLAKKAGKFKGSKF